MHLLSRFAATALMAHFASLAHAHTWPEELQVIGPNGSYIGDRGYPRGYVARTGTGFTGDSNLWLLPSLEARMSDGGVRLRINSTDNICKPTQQTSTYDNPAYPKLKVAPGDSLAVKYLENGHVTLPWTLSGKPAFGGTVFVYGTTQPSDDEKIADVLQWNSEGTGGDKRGSLLTAQTYDDGRCHQINDCVNSAIRQALFPNKIPDQPTSPGQEQWCETDLTIPSTAQVGGMTLYWVWQWPTDAGADCSFPEGKDEFYTSCIDIDIVQDGSGQAKIATGPSSNTLVQENFQTAAVSSYKSRVALTTSPSFSLENWGGALSKRTAAPNGTFSSSCSTKLASLAANAGIPPPACPSGLWATGEAFASISSSVLGSHNTGVIFLAPGSTETYPASAKPSAAPSMPAPEPTGGARSGAAGPGYTAPGSSQGAIQSVSGSAVIQTTTITRIVTVTGVPSVYGAPGGQRNANKGSGPHFNTIKTIGRISGRDDAGEHLDQHRRHARHFA